MAKDGDIGNWKVLEPIIYSSTLNTTKNSDAIRDIFDCFKKILYAYTQQTKIQVITQKHGCNLHHRLKANPSNL